MARKTPTRDLPAHLAALRTILAEAARQTETLLSDPLLARLVDVFREMPAEDRTVILDVLEREVAARKLTAAAADMTGQASRPNPNARLYVRHVGAEARREDLDRDEMTLTTLRIMHVVPMIFEPALHEPWRAAITDALTLAEPAERDALERGCREVVELVAECREAEARGDLRLTE